MRVARGNSLTGRRRGRDIGVIRTSGYRSPIEKVKICSFTRKLKAKWEVVGLNDALKEDQVFIINDTLNSRLEHAIQVEEENKSM